MKGLAYDRVYLGRSRQDANTTRMRHVIGCCLPHKSVILIDILKSFGVNDTVCGPSVDSVKNDGMGGGIMLSGEKERSRREYSHMPVFASKSGLVAWGSWNFESTRDCRRSGFSLVSVQKND